jgi:hypothetical protein
MREDENSSGQIERERELQNQLTITIESEENNEATMSFNADVKVMRKNCKMGYVTSETYQIHHRIKDPILSVEG